MLRTALFIAATFTPTFAHAMCDGPGFLDRLTVDQRSDMQAQAAAIPFANGNRWLVTKDDTALTIVGTMHLPDPRHQATYNAVEYALEAADLLMVEATFDDQVAIQTHMARNPDLMTLDADTSLPELLDDATWAAVRDAASARGIPGFLAAKMQPWFLSLTLAIPPCAMTAMANGEGGLDNMLMDGALDMDIPIMALEPWQHTFGLLTAGTFEDQIAALRVGLIDVELQNEFIVSLVDLYFAQSSAMGWNLSFSAKDFLPPAAAETFDAQMAELEQTLLFDRNASWIPVINDAAAIHDKIMVAFGAAHLFGDQGVLRLLELDGWTVTRL